MSSPLPLPEYRACPHCAEPILVEARRCKHCRKSVPPFSQPEVPGSKRSGWKAIGGFLVAFVAWAIYYFGTWTPPPVTTQEQLARRPATVLAIKPQEPGEARSIAETFVENTGNETIATNEAAMLARLRTVNTAQTLYDATYNSGFAPSFAALNQANMIDSQLASQRTGNYIFYYKPVIFGGQIKQYWLWARPSAYNRTAVASCITNETGALHCTNEDRFATFSDTVIQ